jgi:hypothetical protein
VGIDEAGHEHASSAIDDFVAGGGRTIGYFSDARALYKNVDACFECFGFTIKDARGLKDYALGHFVLSPECKGSKDGLAAMQEIVAW